MFLSGKHLKDSGAILNGVDRTRYGVDQKTSFGYSYAGYDLRLGPKIIVDETYEVESRQIGYTVDGVYQIHNILVVRPSYAVDFIYHQYVIPDSKNYDNDKFYRMINMDDGDSKRGIDQFNMLAIAPLTTILVETVEEFSVPNDLVGIVLGKSTYARHGLLINATPLEPGWRGILTLEVTNLSRYKTICLKRGHGIAQVLFAKITSPEYYDGNYQDQVGVRVS
jgi:deoxycytidine triphosphate deaminase